MRILLIFIAILFFGCTTASNTNITKIPIEFNASAYNNIANNYLERPTFATLYTPKNGNDPWINISMETYGFNQAGQNVIINAFNKSSASSYIELIDKYLEWETLATKDKDIINKKIGSAKSKIFNINFTFYSANENSHYLTIGMPGADQQYFSKPNALALKELLLNLNNHKLKPLDSSEKYR
jgi:hypothetical protein